MPMPEVGAKAGDEHVRVENTAEVFLLRAVVLAAAGHFEVQQVTVEVDASTHVGYGDRSVIDTQKKLRRRSLPFCLSFARRKVNQFEVMPVGVAKVERDNARCFFVPLGKGLRDVRHKTGTRTPHTLAYALSML